ncbi:hypothetical protein Zmor_021183 [Zophobas morio]|uniref:Peptidase S1 domain-containing protein n=1 Tax=Zophobas morio TaxID=2755281 RepID=A0AA38I5H7_9CUCU|nr:hypothetical protein Zmor_021183 [Zophobas morio]
MAPVALPSGPLEGGEEVTVSGVGGTSDDVDHNDILKYITVTTITNSDFIVEGMVYTSAGGDSVKNICTGDSGGPAVLNAADGDPQQVGIVSFGGDTGCEQRNPSGFTRIAYYRNWIKEKSGV